MANEFEDYQALLDDLDIDVSLLDDESGSGGSRAYTPFTRVEDIRVLTSKWGDADSFTWSMPGNPDYTEELEGLANPNLIGGYILGVQIKPSLDEKGDDGLKKNTVCSVVGFRHPVTHEWLKQLPDFYPLSGMYSWDAKNGIPDRKSPAEEVDRLKLVGSRGQFCADCIRCGNSVLTDENGEVTAECSPYGRMFFYLTEVGRVKKIAPKKAGEEPTTQTTIKTIKELLGEDGVILMIKLPHKTGIKGKWDAKVPDNRRVAYASYVRGLKMQFKGRDPRRDPRYVYTTISIKPPIEGAVSKKNFLSFEAVDYNDPNSLKVSHKLVHKAIEEWSKVNPNRAKVLLEDIPGVVPMIEPASKPALPMRKVEVLDQEDNPFA